MDIVFDDDNARVLRSVHDELISAVEDDVVAVARIECHQGVTTTKCLGPSGEMISKFELRVVGDGVEVVVAVDQAGQTLLDDVEERVELANLLQSSRRPYRTDGAIIPHLPYPIEIQRLARFHEPLSSPR